MKEENIKIFLNAIKYGVIFFIFLCIGVFCSFYLQKLVLEESGYTYIEYDAGCYKVYDNNTKVIYQYSEETDEFHPVYNNDGSLMIYKTK